MGGGRDRPPPNPPRKPPRKLAGPPAPLGHARAMWPRGQRQRARRVQRATPNPTHSCRYLAGIGMWDVMEERGYGLEERRRGGPTKPAALITFLSRCAAGDTLDRRTVGFDVPYASTGITLFPVCRSWLRTVGGFVSRFTTVVTESFGGLAVLGNVSDCLSALLSHDDESWVDARLPHLKQPCREPGIPAPPTLLVSSSPHFRYPRQRQDRG